MGAQERHEQITFPSRKTTFTLFAEDVGDGWLQLLNLIMRCGTVKSTRRGERLREVLNAVATVKLAGEEEIPACLDIGAGEMEEHCRRFISPSRPGDAEYCYGERLQGWPWVDPQTGRAEQVNQLERTIDRLQSSHDTKRGTMVLLGPADLDALEAAPCVVLITFNVVDERLYGTYVLRSDDTYNAWPLDAVCLMRLQREVSQRLDIPADSATFISHSAHIYEKDWDRAWDRLDKWFERPLPFKSDPSGLFFFGVEDDRVKALFVDNQADTVLWEGESRDPQELVRYIVDTMPWLPAQHVRYLGEEAARLAAALSQGVPYEQG